MTATNALMASASPRAMFYAPASASMLLRGPQVTYSPEEGAALTIEQATEALLSPPTVEVEEAPEAAAEDPHDEPDTEIPADEASEPAEDATDEGDAEPLDGEDEGEAEPEPVAALEAPAYWSKDAKAKFAQLNPDLQAVVLEQEGPREAAAAKAKAEAAKEVEQAREQAKGVQTLAQQLEGFLPEAVATFQQRWGEPDWEATIRQYGAEEAAVLRARYDKEQAQLQQLNTQTQTARQQAHQAYMVEQFQVLATLDPELAPDAKDPSKGADKRQEVSKYLLDQGVAPGAIAQISASELIMARKAMLWDQAEAARKVPPKPAQQSANPQRRPTPKPGARPAGSAAASPQTQGRTSAQNAFNAKPSIDNAVALLMARSKS